MKISAKLLLFSFLIITIIVSGCSYKKNINSDDMYYSAESGVTAEISYDEIMPIKAESSPSKAKISEASVSNPSDRMVHYNGYAKLKVIKPSATLNKASAIVINAGGYVEKRRERSAGFRIPVKKFKTIFNKILELGIVLKKSISAEDITDQYTDMSLRLKISKKSLKRYMELLVKTEDEEEKIRLLKEISRLNEEVEFLENSVKVLSLLANFSRLNLQTIPHNKISSRIKLKDIKVFNWINTLTPFSYQIAEKGDKLSFDVPEKLVLIKGNIWRTESADGTAFWAHKRANNPDGNTNFWINALKVRLEKEFTTAEVKTAGMFQYLKLTSLSEKPYIYYIGVKADKNNLNVFEAYFPDVDQEKTYSDSILKVLE